MKIIFCGGGTLGSVTPLLATIDKLKELEPKAVPVWVGTRTGVERTFVSKTGVEYRWIFAAKLRRYFDWRNFAAPFVLIVATFQSIWLLFRLRPKAVVVSGSFVQVPLVMAARTFGVPVALHQEDIEVGLANRISSYDAKVITATFEASVPQFGKKKVQVIGNPVRRMISDLADPVKRATARERGMKRWNLDAGRPTVLVLGGGTGAMDMNDWVARDLEKLVATVNVVHLAGQGKIAEAKPRQNYVVFEFLNEEMGEAYAVADLAVSRAGLGTLTELGSSGIATVLVPLPGHQEKNAAYLAERGAVVAVSSLAGDRVLTDTVLRLANDRDRRLELSRAIAGIFPSDAAEKLAKIILSVIPAR